MTKTTLSLSSLALTASVGAIAALAMVSSAPAAAETCLLDTNGNSVPDAGDSDAGATADGDTELACGRVANADGEDALAIGTDANASGPSTTAVGGGKRCDDAWRDRAWLAVPGYRCDGNRGRSSDYCLGRPELRRR